MKKKKKLKVFLSHPMSNLDKETVCCIRNSAIHYLTEKYKTEFLEIIDNYYHNNKFKSDVPTEYHFAESIKQMVRADIIYFCKGWESSNGCKIEKMICDNYENLKNKVEIYSEN